MGLCGQSYGIITKSFNDTPVTIEFIKEQVKVLYSFAVLRPDLTFYVTKIGTSLAGFTMQDIAGIFKEMPFNYGTGERGKPSNIVLPIEFSTL